MPEPSKQRWYFNTHVIVLSFLVIGPLVLPLIWFRPRASLTAKILWSVVVIILSVGMTALMARSLRSIGHYYALMQQGY